VTTLSRRLGRALALVVAALLALLAAIAAAETVLWGGFGVSWAAAPEIQGTLLVWFALLSAAWGVRERLHMAVDLVARGLSPALEALCQRLAAGMVLAFGALFAFYCARLVAAVTNTLPATGVGAWVQYLPAPVAGVLIAFFALERLLEGGGIAAREPVAPGGDPHDG
jgi:TRAP-type transport system small permease protein